MDKYLKPVLFLLPLALIILIFIRNVMVYLVYVYPKIQQLQTEGMEILGVTTVNTIFINAVKICGIILIISSVMLVISLMLSKRKFFIYIYLIVIMLGIYGVNALSSSLGAVITTVMYEPLDVMSQNKMKEISRVVRECDLNSCVSEKLKKN
jgi:hypothetical protein